MNWLRALPTSALVAPASRRHAFPGLRKSANKKPPASESGRYTGKKLQ
jgi:hypothetical protein